MHARAPLVGVAVLLGGGIVAEPHLHWPPVVYALAILGLLAVWGLLRSRGIDRRWCVPLAAAAVFLLGSARIGLTRHAAGPDAIRFKLTENGQLVEMVGRVESEPTLRPRTIADFETIIDRDPGSAFVVRAESVRQGLGAWEPASGRVRVVCSGPALHVTPGQRLTMTGTLFPIRAAANPGSPDWRRASHDKGIFAVLWVPADGGATPIGAAGAPLQSGQWSSGPSLTWREEIRLRAHRLLLGDAEPLTDDDRLLLDGILLGRRGPGARELTRPFVRTGTYHFLAVSGLHVGILAGFTWLLLRLLRVRHRRAAAIVLGLVAVYCLMAEPRPPILRAGITIGLLCVGAMLWRSAPPVNLLAAAAVILLMIDPGELLGAGFQLSFTVVLGLLIFTGPVHGWMARRVLRADPDAPEDWRLWFRAHPLTAGAVNRGLQLLAVSVVAWAVGGPLVAWHFGRFHPWAVVSSLMLWPIVWALLVTGFAKMFLALLVPTLAAWLNGPLHSLSSALMAAVGLLDRLPATGMPVARPAIALVALYYAWLLAMRFRPKWLRPRTAFAAGAVVLLATAAVWATPSGDVELAVLDVGDGAAHVLRLPDGDAVLLDAGSIERGDVGEEVVLPYLAATQDRPGPVRVRATILSHPNLDHYSGLPSLARNGLVGELLHGPSPPVSPGTLWSTRQMLTMLKNEGVPMRRASAGDVLDLGGVRGEVLWPPRWVTSAEGVQANDGSLVVRLRFGRRSVLATGDIMAFAQQRLLDGHAAGEIDLHSDVLLMPHHGAVVENTDAFVRAVDPAVVVVSTRREPADILARCEALREPGRRVLFTCRDGAVIVRLTSSGDLHVQKSIGRP